MTNGEMIQSMFPNMNFGTLAQDDVIVNKDYSSNDEPQVFIPKRVWNAEYKEPNKSEIPTSSTTKNDLRVREFEEIVVEYPPEDLCTYPEYKGKPYFSIKYKEGNDCFVGYGTYNPKVFSRYLRDYFMSSVTPTRPKGHCVYDYKAADGHRVYHCSECGCYLKPKHTEPLDSYKWCSLCGADMREVETNLEIKTVENAEEAEAYPINENIVKGFEEFTKMMFKQGQAESEEE